MLDRDLSGRRLSGLQSAAGRETPPINSFRGRLALLVDEATAIMLLVIGGLAWELIARFNRERLDREMNNVAKPILQRTGDVRHGQRVEAALRFVAGPDRSFEHVLWVKNYDRVVYRSPRWPAEIAPENYPPPTSYAHGLAFTTPPRRHRRAG